MDLQMNFPTGTVFRLKSKTVAVDPNGVEVELSKGNRLIYREERREIVFRYQHEIIQEVLLATHLAVPPRPKWNTGELLTEEEAPRLKRAIEEGLLAFGSLTIWTPQSVIDAYWSALLSGEAAK